MHLLPLQKHIPNPVKAQPTAHHCCRPHCNLIEKSTGGAYSEESPYGKGEGEVLTIGPCKLFVNAYS